MSPDSHLSINNRELIKDVMRGFEKVGNKTRETEQSDPVTNMERIRIRIRIQMKHMSAM